MDTRDEGSRIGRVVTGRVRIREARLPPMRAVRTTRQVRDRRRARAAERRAEVERRAEIRALEALAAQLGAANVGALGESPSSPPATILASADRDALPADPHQALRLLQRECASLRAHARTVDARVQREVEAAAAIAAEKAADDAHAALERRLAETARALDDARVARADAEARAAHAEGSTDVVRARHAAKISAAVADAVAAERARGAETLRLAAAAAAAAAAAGAEPSSEEQDEVIERLRGELARARAETVRARADAEAAARNNVGAARAGAVRAASDARRSTKTREDSSRTRRRSTPPWRRTRARWVPRGARRRGGHRSSRGEEGRCIRSRRRDSRADRAGGRTTRRARGRPSGGWRRACARRRSESRRGRIPGRWCSREGAEERVWERGRRARDVQSSPRPKSDPIFAL